MTSSQKDMFDDSTAALPDPLKLQIYGAIPSFKNNKMLITKSPKGQALPRPLLITKPEFQKRMSEIINSFVSQCWFAFRTGAEPTCPENSIRSWIASRLPADDCWEIIPEILISGMLCKPGEEGATVIIEAI